MKLIAALWVLSSLVAAAPGVSATHDLQTFIPGESPIDYCTSPPPETDLIVIDKLVISPNPPERGQNLTILASGSVKEDIKAGAYVQVEVKYGFITLIKTKLDLCEQTEKVDLSCPIEEGTITLERTVELPREIPPGKYTVKAAVFTDDDRPITCLVARTTQVPRITRHKRMTDLYRFPR